MKDAYRGSKFEDFRIFDSVTFSCGHGGRIFTSITNIYLKIRHNMHIVAQAFG